MKIDNLIINPLSLLKNIHEVSRKTIAIAKGTQRKHSFLIWFLSMRMKERKRSCRIAGVVTGVAERLRVKMACLLVKDLEGSPESWAGRQVPLKERSEEQGAEEMAEASVASTALRGETKKLKSFVFRRFSIAKFTQRSFDTFDVNPDRKLLFFHFFSISVKKQISKYGNRSLSTAQTKHLSNQQIAS